jgi:hypothetical protein
MSTMNPAPANRRSSSPRRALARLGILAALLPTTAAGLMVAAPAASADASGCDTFHNVCIAVTGDTGSEVQITATPNGSGFSGMFTATGPGYSSTSPDQYWDPNTGSYTCTVYNAPGGEYCVSGYSDNNTNEGMACETVS